MLKALYAASTGMDAQQVRIENISNNLSNLNTIGYKASRESFEDLMYDQIKTPGLNNSTNTIAPVGIQMGHGTKLVGVYKHFSQGEMNQSNRELDVAIEGSGFLQVTQANGQIAYTRDGNLKLNSQGQLVSNNGLVVSPTITIPTTATSVTIGKDGTVSIASGQDTTAQQLGIIQLAVFQNPSGLKSLGQNLYQETTASGSPTLVTAGESGSGEILQGFLENSNVNVAEELINMIVAQRSYEANAKVLSAASQMMQASNNVS